MWRLFAYFLLLGACPGVSGAQTTSVFCNFDDGQGLVLCIKGSESEPIFRYHVASADMGMLAGLSSVDGTKTNEERCRIRAEDFRVQQLEGKLNNSIEDLRITAESIRSASETNLSLYKQIMVVYDALVDRYKNGIQAYQSFIKACHVTPYDVRPDRPDRI